MATSVGQGPFVKKQNADSTGFTTNRTGGRGGRFSPFVPSSCRGAHEAKPPSSWGLIAAPSELNTLDPTSGADDTSRSINTLEREGASLVTVQEVIELLESHGWQRTRQDACQQFKHDSKAGTVTLNGQLQLVVPEGALRALLRHAEIEGET